MPDSSVKKIRITNVAQLPAEYFLRERVLKALRLEVQADVRAGKPLPAGAAQGEDRSISAGVNHGNA